MKKVIVMMLSLFLLLILNSPGRAFAAEQNEWVKKSNLITPRTAHSVASVNGKIYAIGGSSSNTAALKTVEEYNPSTDTWRQVASMNIARYRPKAVSFEGKIYVFGGLSSINPSTYLNSIEVYDPTNDKWSLLPTSMSHPASDVMAATVNNKIYVIGGITTGNVLSNSVEEFDPHLNTWTTKASVPSPRQAAGIEVVNNKIYVMGGTAGGYNRTVQVYDPSTNIWTSNKDMPVDRANFGITTANKKIYVLGGNSPSSGDVSIYDPASDTWTAGPMILEPRYLAAATVLNDSIYLIGGNDILGSHSGVTEALSTVISKEFILSGQNSKSSNNLSWTGQDNILKYTLKRSTKSGGPYVTINESTNTNYVDDSIQPNQIYYYVVTATNNQGTIKDSNEISLLSQDNSDSGKALLTITLTNGTQKEYDLTMAEVNAFLEWYDARDASRGPGMYAIDKHTNNKGPFKKRKDYVVFDKILTYEVSEYTAGE